MLHKNHNSRENLRFAIKNYTHIHISAYRFLLLYAKFVEQNGSPKAPSHNSKSCRDYCVYNVIDNETFVKDGSLADTWVD